MDSEKEQKQTRTLTIFPSAPLARVAGYAPAPAGAGTGCQVPSADSRHTIAARGGVAAPYAAFGPFPAVPKVVAPAPGPPGSPYAAPVAWNAPGLADHDAGGCHCTEAPAGDPWATAKAAGSPPGSNLGCPALGRPPPVNGEGRERVRDRTRQTK